MFSILKRIIFPSTTEPTLWHPILEEVRLQRGDNRYRGRQTAVLSKKEIRFEILRRYGEDYPREMIIYVGNNTDETFFITPNDKIKVTASEFVKLSDFITKVLLICRKERDYICTDPQRTTYK